MDVQRFVLEFTQDLAPDLGFEVEIEFEHGGTGAAMELEYEEFGEFETEVEKGGEVALEQLHLTKPVSPALNVRLGHFVVPVGAVNAHHLPHGYFGTVRPEGETSLVPVVWHETGAEVFGDVGDFRYRLQLVNGLDSTGFQFPRLGPRRPSGPFRAGQRREPGHGRPGGLSRPGRTGGRGLVLPRRNQRQPA